MRIAFVGTRGVPPLYGGFETAVAEIGKRFVKRGHDVTVYCRRGYGNESERIYEGIKKRFLPRIKLKAADTVSHTLLSLVDLAFKPPDVILVFGPANGPLCVIPRLRGTPFAIHVAGLEFERGKWSSFYWAYRFASWFCTKIVPTITTNVGDMQQKYKAIIADSSGIQEFYKDTWNCNTYYASYGAYIEQSTKPEFIEEYGLVKDNYFLVVARLQASNNTELAIKAFQDTHTDKILVIVGDGGYESDYVRYLKSITKDERILFLGGIYNQEHLTEIMCNCFAYVHCHMVGGTNPILLKALGCGTCILYLDTGYHFNKRVAGNYGIPFPMTVEGLREQIQRLVEYPDKVLPYRLHAPERIKEFYTWDITTDHYEELCYSLCAKS